MKKIFLTLSVLYVGMFAFSQYQNKDGNRIGIAFGLNQSTLLNSNFTTKPDMGFAGGLSVRGNYYNNWSMIYGMQFFRSNFIMNTYTAASPNRETQFNISGAQVRLLLSYNIIKNHISFDFGPVLQINDKLKTASEDENRFIEGTSLKAVQISDIGKFHGAGYVGISAGTRRIRAVVFYQYGFTNLLNKLNSQEGLQALNGNQKFEANLGTINGQILFNL